MLEYAALVGIDWSDAKHDVCLLDCASGRREPAVIKHTPEEIDRWADSLRRRYPGQKVAVCLEQARGPLVYALLKYDFLTLYPINPKTPAKFREAATVEAVAEFDRQIERLCRTHQDYEVFASLPGSGTVYSSRLLAAFGTDRARFASAERVACLAGVAPVVERGGQSKWVHWRFCCPKLLRQSFVEYAGESVRHSFWARAFYMQQRARGKSHQVAVRALAYKWIRIMYRCWQTRQPYNEVEYLESLRQKGSPLLRYAAENQA